MRLKGILERMWRIGGVKVCDEVGGGTWGGIDSGVNVSEELSMFAYALIEGLILLGYAFSMFECSYFPVSEFFINHTGFGDKFLEDRGEVWWLQLSKKVKKLVGLREC